MELNIKCCRDVAEKTISFIFRILTDPIVFVSFLAPIFIRFALKVLSDAAISTHHSTETLFAHPAFPGVTDYIMQYYTACIAFILWVFKSGWLVVIPLIQENKQNESQLIEHPWKHSGLSRKAYGTFSVIFFLFGFIVLFGNGAAQLSLLEVYVNHITKLGQWRLPPPNSIISWLRAIVKGGVKSRRVAV